jgi:hypothetical protein
MLSCRRPSATPALQHRLEVAELEEEVLRFALDGAGAGQHGDRVQQFRRAIGRAADFAAVAVLVGRAAARAGAAHEAIRQEHAFLLVEGLADGAGLDVPAGLQRSEDFLDDRAVLGGVGAVVVVELDVEACEVLELPGVDLADQVLGRDAILAGLEHDRGAMGVAGADVDAAMAPHALEAHPDVGLDVLDHVADVQRPVRVGQGAGDEDFAAFAHGLFPPDRGVNEAGARRKGPAVAAAGTRPPGR